MRRVLRWAKVLHKIGYFLSPRSRLPSMTFTMQVHMLHITLGITKLDHDLKVMLRVRIPPREGTWRRIPLIIPSSFQVVRLLGWILCKDNLKIIHLVYYLKIIIMKFFQKKYHKSVKWSIISLQKEDTYKFFINCVLPSF